MKRGGKEGKGGGKEGGKGVEAGRKRGEEGGRKRRDEEGGIIILCIKAMAEEISKRVAGKERD